VDRRAHRRGDPEWLAAAWGSPRGLALVVGSDGRVAADEQAAGPAALRWVPAAGLSPTPPPAAAYLGGDDGAEFFALFSVGSVPQGRTLRDIGAQLPATQAGLLTHAVALAAWHAAHRHCPRCGSVTRPVQAGHARQCPVDATTHFPRTDPAVIMLVTSPDARRAVFGRQPRWPTGRFSCLAGFVEAGEAAEQAVVREVAEEVGLDVREVRFGASQPWPFPASLMLAFTAVADVAPIVLRDGELAEAGWFTRDELSRLLLPPRVSVARWLIDAWLAGGSAD
jgi:NAD+ diphosphatase